MASDLEVGGRRTWEARRRSLDPSDGPRFEKPDKLRGELTLLKGQTETKSLPLCEVV